MSYEVTIYNWVELTKLVKPGMLIEINCMDHRDNSHNFILFLMSNKLKYINSQNTSIQIDDWYQGEPDLSIVLFCSKQKTKEHQSRLYFFHKNNKVFLDSYKIIEYLSRGIKITVLN